MSDIKRLKIEGFLKKYISVSSNADWDFKGYLKYSINKEFISKEEALLIILEVMYGINNLGWDYDIVPDKLEELVEKYRYDEFNSNKKDYFNEEILLNEYIEKFSKNKNKRTRNINNSFSDEDNKHQVYSLKEIRNNLNSLSRNDLCFILDINPDLNFEKDKILKNRIANELTKYPINLNELKNFSSEDIKRYMNRTDEESGIKTEDISKKTFKQKTNVNNSSVIKNDSNIKSDNISKKDKVSNSNDVSELSFTEILEKVSDFNKMTLHDMSKSKSEYSEIYDIVNNPNCKVVSTDFEEFIYLYRPTRITPYEKLI